MTSASFDKAAQHLEWERLAAAVRARCRGETARRNGLTYARDREHAALLLRETGEVLALLERGERVPLDDLRDIDPHLARLEREGALHASALNDVLVTLQNARVLRTLPGRPARPAAGAVRRLRDRPGARRARNAAARRARAGRHALRPREPGAARAAAPRSRTCASASSAACAR